MGRFKDAIRPLIDKHQSEVKEIRKAYEDAINSTISSAAFTKEYKQSVIGDLKKEMKATLSLLDGKYNKQLKDAVTAEKPSTLGNRKEKPADYQVQIANALKFIEMAGKGISDDQAYEILKPFQGDHETMILFKNAVTGMAGNLSNRFEKTFRDTNDYQSMMGHFKSIEGDVDRLFNSGDDSYSARLKVHIFKESVDSIDQISLSLNGEE